MIINPTTLITGASSGIGEALTHRFANAGHDLVLVARSAGKLKALANQLKTEHDIKVLVLPAELVGRNACGSASCDRRSHTRLRLAVQRPAEPQAFRPTACGCAPLHPASKAYVLSLTESLSEELKGTGVTITALCPGITATHMLDTATETNGQLTKLPGFLIGNVDDVARDGFDACMRGDVICVPGTIYRVARLAFRSTPKWLLRRVSGMLARTSNSG